MSEKTGEALLEGLAAQIAAAGPWAVAVSGGVDSLTLAHAIQRAAGEPPRVFHAVSPAVTPEATVRVRAHSLEAGWTLTVFDAGEFADPAYRANPIDRCYFCKGHLYGAIRHHWTGTLGSGTNTDDLRDFRPGLRAAEEWSVQHPFVAAGIDKAGVRRLARHLGLDDVHNLPAEPCLSSRVETRIPIDERDLAMVHRIERLVAEQLRAGAVRCRVRRRGVVIESDDPRIGDPAWAPPADLNSEIERICLEWRRPFAGFEPYRTGSASLHTPPAVGSPPA